MKSWRRNLSLVLFTFLAALLLNTPARADSTSICLPEDNQTCLVLTAEAIQELQKATNSYGDDVHISIRRIASQEVGHILRSIEIQATQGSSGQNIPDFSFKNPVTLRFGHWCLFENQGGALTSNTTSTITFTAVNDPRQWMGLYWDNGQSLVRLQGMTIDADQSIGVTVHSVGHYQIQVMRSPNTLELSHGSPYPRIITPGAQYNRRTFFFVENPGSGIIQGSIYDFLGAKVRNLEIDALSPAPNVLVWDARDDGGHIVPSGPYYYKISASGQSVSGSLVIAR